MIELADYLSHQYLVDIKLKAIADEVSGFTSDFNNALVLIPVYENFQLDGYSVLPRNSIQNDASTNTLLLCEKVLSDNSIKVCKPNSIPIDSMALLFKSIQKNNELVLIDAYKKIIIFLLGVFNGWS